MESVELVRTFADRINTDDDDPRVGIQGGKGFGTVLGEAWDNGTEWVEKKANKAADKVEEYLWKKLLRIALLIFGPILAILLSIGCCYFAPCWLPQAVRFVGMLWDLRPGRERNPAGPILGGTPALVNAVELTPMHKATAPLLYEEPPMFAHAYVPRSYNINVPGGIQPKVVMKMGGVEFKALFDTGSSVTYCQQSTFRAIWPHRTLDPPHVGRAKAANSTVIPFLGQTKATLSVPEADITMTVLVSEDNLCPVSLLIGTDWLRHMNHCGFDVFPNLEKECLFIVPTSDIVEKTRNSTLPLCAQIEWDWDVDDEYFQHTPQGPRVCVAETTDLAPHSDTFLWGTVNEEVGEEDVYLLEDGPCWKLPFVNIARLVATPGKSGLMPVRLMNCGNAPMRLYAGMTIGFLELVAAPEETPPSDPVPETPSGPLPMLTEFLANELKWAIGWPRFSELLSTLKEHLRLDVECRVAESAQSDISKIIRRLQAWITPVGQIKWANWHDRVPRDWTKFATPLINSLLPEENMPRSTDYLSEELKWHKDLPQFPDPLEDLLKKLNLEECCLSPKAQDLLKEIIRVNFVAFVGPDGNIGCYTGPVQHRIDLIEDKYVQSRPYRVSPLMRDEIIRQIEDMLRQRIIQPSTSPFCSPIILVPKADKKSWRFVVDYRKLNKNTKKSTYFLPLISDILDEIGGKNFYTCCDLQSGFHQLSVIPEHRERTAFGCFYGLFEYLRMPMGLCGAPQTFQLAMERLRKELSAAFLIYLDDIILGSLDEDTHLRDLDEFFRAIVKNGMKLRLDKCVFGRKEVKYLGFLISGEGIRPDPKNVTAVAQFKAPKTLTELRSLIGALSYFRKFIKDFAEDIAPLNDLTSKEGTVETHWTNSHQQSMDKLIQKLISAPVLAAPVFGRPFVIETDASSIAIGACLLQEDKEQALRPVCYASRKLQKGEKKFSTMELEALAVVFAVAQFRPYIEGNGTTVVRTDNSALTTALQMKNASTRLMKFQVALQAYDLKITHRSGASNRLCDHLSRWPTETESPQVHFVDEEIEEIERAVVTNRKAELREHTEGDNLLKEVIRRVRAGWPEEHSMPAELGPYSAVRGTLFFRDGFLRVDSQLVIPKTMQEELLQRLHATHMGRDKMLARAKRIWWWPGMSTDIDNLAKACEICHQVAPERPDASLAAWPKAQHPNEKWHIDYAGPFEGSMWLIVVDSYSKYAWVKKTVRSTAQSTIDLLEELFACFGSPNALVSDNGSQLVAHETEEFLRDYGVRHVTSAPYHPASNGEAERFVGQFKTAVEKIMCEKPHPPLTQAVRRFLQYYRSTPHSSTGETPSQLYLKREMRTPLDSYAVEIALPAVAKKAETRKKKPQTFTHDQDVWVRNHRQSGAKWVAGVVVGVRGNAMYEVETSEGDTRMVHADQLNTRRSLPQRGVNVRTVKTEEEAENVSEAQ